MTTNLFLGQEPLRPLHEAPQTRQEWTTERRFLSQGALRPHPTHATHRYENALLFCKDKLSCGLPRIGVATPRDDFPYTISSMVSTDQPSRPLVERICTL